MKPWTSGPRELIEHAKEHFEQGSAFDMRIAFISVDNAVELIIKTYLGLPKRIRKSEGPSRKKLSEALNSFPDLLDLIEEFGEEKLEGIELGDIEWYHRIRNTLYHDGNGVTVDKDKVDSYLQITTILFKNLFEDELTDEEKVDPQTAVGEIVLRASQLEHNARILHNKFYPEHIDRKLTLRRMIWDLGEGPHIPVDLVDKINNALKIRNEAVHSSDSIDSKVVMQAAEDLFECVDIFANMA